MSSLRASSPTESSSLLEDAPSSYHSVNEVDESTTQNRQADGVTTVNQFSKTELYWILAGLWSGVLLGAFDGRTYFFPKLSISDQEQGTVVATLLAPIGSEFKASHQSSYIGTSYLLSVCCFTPLYGKVLFNWLSYSSNYSRMQEDWRISWAGRAQCYSHYPSSVVQIILMSIYSSTVFLRLGHNILRLCSFNEIINSS